MSSMLKEPYFTEKTISIKSRQMFDSAAKNTGQRSVMLDRGRTAFVIIDMQEYFCNPASHAFIPASEAIIAPIKKVQKACVESKAPVVFTRHINTSENAKMLGTWWKDVIKRESPFASISRKFETEGYKVVEKMQYDAFFGTELEGFLKSSGISTIVFAGVMTNLCCETTVRSAFVRGFRPYLPVDLTATVSELFHLSTILNLSYGFAAPSLSSQILDCLGQW